MFSPAAGAKFFLTNSKISPAGTGETPTFIFSSCVVATVLAVVFADVLTAVLEAELGELQLANNVDAVNDIAVITNKRRLILIKGFFMRSPLDSVTGVQKINLPFELQNFI
ncbi:hypothetical protein [Nostoc sp. NMS8]|uniref:hypothetical protein n=1 Tax=Nostoc sp. NMS8 TaxID=2815392 RepID=UPI0025FC5016|nr:hypothetical protein [Nostoc sp. NMS8]